MKQRQKVEEDGDGSSSDNEKEKSEPKARSKPKAVSPVKKQINSNRRQENQWKPKSPRKDSLYTSTKAAETKVTRDFQFLQGYMTDSDGNY